MFITVVGREEGREYADWVSCCMFFALADGGIQKWSLCASVEFPRDLHPMVNRVPLGF